jgi:hypothetical protein
MVQFSRDPHSAAAVYTMPAADDEEVKTCNQDDDVQKTELHV